MKMSIITIHRDKEEHNQFREYENKDFIIEKDINRENLQYKSHCRVQCRAFCVRVKRNQLISIFHRILTPFAAKRANTTKHTFGDILYNTLEIKSLINTRFINEMLLRIILGTRPLFLCGRFCFIITWFFFRFTWLHIDALVQFDCELFLRFCRSILLYFV